MAGTIDPDPLNQYVHHPYYVDAVAVRYYDATISGTQVRQWYLQDVNFSVTAVVNHSGSVQERYAYSPYGANPGTAILSAMRMAFSKTFPESC